MLDVNHFQLVWYIHHPRNDGQDMVLRGRLLFGCLPCNKRGTHLSLTSCEKDFVTITFKKIHIKLTYIFILPDIYLQHPGVLFVRPVLKAHLTQFQLPNFEEDNIYNDGL